jgi:hypothetical protein
MSVSFKVGDGATISLYTDRQAGTICEIRKNGKEVVWQRDLVSSVNTPAERNYEQNWKYATDPNGIKHTFTLRKNGQWIELGKTMKNGLRLSFGRNEYYDYGF